jgi:hypothetical protein
MRLTLLLAAALTALLLLAGGRGPGGAAVGRLQLVEGSLSLKNSLDGEAVFSAEDIAPGDSTAGTVTVSNAGSLTGDLTLTGSEPVDTPGPGGGALSERLGLVVQDVTGAPPATVYVGPLDELGALPLGTLGPGASRVYRFTASLPASADESVAGASTIVAYKWIVASAPAGERPPVRRLMPWPAPAEAPPAAPHGPHVTIRVPRRQRALRRHRLVAYASCLETCRLVARARLPGRRGGRVLTRRARTGLVPAGRRVRLVFRIPRRSRAVLARRLRAGRRVAVRITIAGSTPAGARATFVKRARVRARRR